MKQKLIIIKLGGSIITDKTKTRPTPNVAAISNLALELQKIYAVNKYHLILVHGAGSFGHPLAKKYQLNKGMRTKEQVLGFALTDQKMLELNSLIMDQLLSKNIPVVSLPPRSFVTQSAGEFHGFDDQLIRRYLGNNQIPILFGDCVLDNKWGCSILSGDTIVAFLADKLKADRVIFLSDVDGVFEEDPKQNPKAKMIPLINNSNIAVIIERISPSNHDDVTGEMQGKLLAIKKHLAGVEVRIINGLKTNVLDELLNHRNLGTKIFFAR